MGLIIREDVIVLEGYCVVRVLNTGLLHVP